MKTTDVVALLPSTTLVVPAAILTVGETARAGSPNVTNVADPTASLLDEPYFKLPAPKSTGRDLFNVDWLTGKHAPFKNLKPVDVQATLTELTARVCCDALQGVSATLAQLIVCGGGAFNAHLMARLAALSGLPVESSQRHGLPPLQVEAAAFAWLARKCVRRETGNVPKVTGAQGARILGAIYPA